LDGHAALLTLAVSINNLTNGITRSVLRLLSDKIGRENAMVLMFCSEGIALFGMAAFGRHPAGS